MYHLRQGLLHFVASSRSYARPHERAPLRLQCLRQNVPTVGPPLPAYEERSQDQPEQQRSDLVDGSDGGSGTQPGDAALAEDPC